MSTASSDAMLWGVANKEINGVQCTAAYAAFQISDSKFQKINFTSYIPGTISPVTNPRSQIPETAAGRYCSACTETLSTQKLPEISMGKVRLRGRQTETRTAWVCGPVANFKMTVCQGVLPTVVSVQAFKQLGQPGSVTRKRGPLSEVMSLLRTPAASV